MQSSKPRSTIGERRGKAKSKPNSANDSYEPSARNNEKRKQRLPEFGLFRTMRECYPPPVRATTARILARRHGALCSLPAAFLNRARARRWLSSAKYIGHRFTLICASGDLLGMMHKI
jgi:hypothetical protein